MGGLEVGGGGDSVGDGGGVRGGYGDRDVKRENNSDVERNYVHRSTGPVPSA